MRAMLGACELDLLIYKPLCLSSPTHSLEKLSTNMPFLSHHDSKGSFLFSQAVLPLLLFRVSDIAQPWPVRRLETLPGGAGIVLDDVAAGLLAAGVFVLLNLLVPALR